MNCVILSAEGAHHPDLEAALGDRSFAFSRVQTGDEMVEACLAEPIDLIVLTRFDDDVLAACQRMLGYQRCFPLILAVLGEETAVDPDRLLAASVDDWILPPLHPQRLRGRLTFARARILMRKESRAVESALRKSEANARAVLETTVDGVISIDANGIIRSFNRAAERIFGYSAEECIGQNVKMLMPRTIADEHDSYVKNYLDTGHRKIIGIGREVQGQRKDGSVFPMDLAVSEVRLDSGRSFTGIVRDITEKRRLEREILRISEQERRRIGQDLHDGLGQMLTGIGLIAQNVARTLEKQGVKEAADVAELSGLIKEADQQARRLARGLVPIEFHSNGLSVALERLAVNATHMFGIPTTFEEMGEPVHVHDSAIATHIYRIAQEATNNAAKHSEASTIRIMLASGQGQLRLRIQDNGIGIPGQRSESAGMGLNIMKHRAHMIGAALDLRTNESEGTVITCTVPYNGTIEHENLTE